MGLPGFLDHHGQVFARTDMEQKYVESMVAFSLIAA
jgi:hypothetical protein